MAKKTWDDEKLKIPDAIKKALIEKEFFRPSKIQCAAVPLISNEPYHNLIA
jgi:superfamily II DNA/RNA helicase